MEMIILWVAQRIAIYGFNKLMDKTFENKESFSNYLYTLVLETIEEFQTEFPVKDDDEKFAFYKSQIILDELLKFRLFEKSGYLINENQIQSALEKNPKIIKPSPEQLEKFFEIFDRKVRDEPKLKKLEIEEFHKEKIYKIFEKVEQILSYLKLHIETSKGLLEEEYFVEIDDCYSDLKNLKPQSALLKLNKLETRIEKNSHFISGNLRANLSYLKGLCLEMNGDTVVANEEFIQAYKILPDNPNYLNRACISYYFLNDLKYKDLKLVIESVDDYDIICWAIDTFESENILTFLQDSVPQNVLDKHRFKRLILNYNLKVNKVNNLHLLNLLEAQKDSRDIPEVIDYDNIHHWIFILNATSITFFQKSEVTYYGHIKRDEFSLFFLQLSKMLARAIVQSELDNSYNNIIFIYYWLESELDITSDTIDRLQESYSKLKEKDSFRTVLYANAIQKTLGFKSALDIINDYKGELDESLLSLKAYCALNLTGTIDPFKEYFSNIKGIDTFNIRNICSFLIQTSIFDEETKRIFIKILEQKNISSKVYERLLKMLIITFSDQNFDIKLEDIDQLRLDLSGENKLFFFIALIYFENKHFEECSKFIKSYVNEEVESIDLFLYIRALDSHKKSKQLELLRVLRHWREKFSFNVYLIHIELEIRQILKDWDEIIVITNYGLIKLPGDELFFTLNIIALNNRKQYNEIAIQVPKALNFIYKASENAIRVALVLIENNFLIEGLEIIYRKAQIKSDSIARLNYFTLTTDLPPGLFAEKETVELDCYVRFQIDGQFETIIIDKQGIDNPLVNLSIGKHQNDTFLIGSTLSKKFKRVRIIRIMNKFLALFDDILSEINSSFSNLPVESITFEGTDRASIEKIFVDNFGATEAERRKHSDQTLKDYGLYNTSFSELTISNFDGQYTEAYYFLTSSLSDGFYAIPSKVISNRLTDDYKRIVLDFSSSLLFYELAKELDLKFEKFILAESTLAFIDRTIVLTENFRKSKMSISIYENKIIPHFYNNEFYDNRIKFLKDIKTWLTNNSEIILPEEKIDVIRTLSSKDKASLSFDYLVDNALLAQRDGNILITDDLIFFKYMHTKNKIFNTENYLVKKFASSKAEILEFLLRSRYIGITLNKDVIYNAYINKNKLGYQHIYNYVLRNISLKLSFSPLNIFAVVDFLKAVALNPGVTYEKFQSDATNILLMLISSFPKTAYNLLLKRRIDLVFKLLGIYHDIMLKSLIDAIRILNRKPA